SDTVVLFWAPRTKHPELVDRLGPLFNVEEAGAIEESLDAEAEKLDAEAKSKRVPKKVLEIFQNVWKGIPPNLEDDTPLYLLTITGQQGRAIVRDWKETTVRKAFDRLAEFFGELSIVRNAPPIKGKEHPPAYPIPVLEKSLGVRGDIA